MRRPRVGNVFQGTIDLVTLIDAQDLIRQPISRLTLCTLREMV